MKLDDYIYDNVLLEGLKLNKVSNRIGKITLQVYNALMKMENGSEYEEYVEYLKRMRLEMASLEKKYYEKKISLEDLKTNLGLYVKGLDKIKKKLAEIEDNKKIKHSLDKIDDLIDKIKKLREVM